MTDLLLGLGFAQRNEKSSLSHDKKTAQSMFYLPLALGQKASHPVLVEGLGRFASQGGERDHPGMEKGLRT